MRLVTAEERPKLHKLVQDNKMILACQTKEKTLKILSDYLQQEFGMHANETTLASYDGVHISGAKKRSNKSFFVKSKRMSKIFLDLMTNMWQKGFEIILLL
ncbi:hypothetical protein Q3C04_02945 [Rickettsia rickettsii]|nr:hypothetical protein [Rickettsia philipii]